MPSIPRSQCDCYQCKAAAITGSRFCEQHTPARAAPKTDRRQKDSLYSSAAWRQIRAAQLSAHPLCECCLSEGRVAAADVVDHVFRWKDYGEQAFRLNLWNSLCSSCHSRKGRLEALGVFRQYRDGSFIDHQAGDWPAAVHLSL